MLKQHHSILDQMEEMFSVANSTMEDFRGTMQESIQQTREQLRGLIDQQGEDMKVNMKQLDNDLGEELTKALQTLGNQLATLSNKFVQDYSPLTDQLRNLVELSRRVQQ